MTNTPNEEKKECCIICEQGHTDPHICLDKRNPNCVKPSVNKDLTPPSSKTGEKKVEVISCSAHNVPILANGMQIGMCSECFPSTPPSEEKKELETIAEVTPTKDGIHVRGRKDIVDRIQKNFERDAIHVSWEPTPPSRKEWEEEFDRLFVDEKSPDDMQRVWGKVRNVKSFIHSLLLSNNQRLVEMIEAKIQSIVNSPITDVIGDDDFRKGEISALSSVKALIENNK